jgi:hypothetical protein
VAMPSIRQDVYKIKSTSGRYKEPSPENHRFFSRSLLIECWVGSKMLGRPRVHMCFSQNSVRLPLTAFCLYDFDISKTISNASDM